MNRRDILKFFGIAPVAAPAIASAAANEMQFASGGTLRHFAPGVMGESFIGSAAKKAAVSTITIDIDTRAAIGQLSAIKRMLGDPQIRKYLRTIAPRSVESQMLEHDLFEPSSFGRGVA